MNYLKPTQYLLLSCLIIVCLALVQISHAQNSPQDFLDAHNAARKAVGVEPMVWDKKIAAYALVHAEYICGNFRHSFGPYGENMVWTTSDSLTAAGAVNMWLNEQSDYNYDSNTCADGKACGHYKQVVGRDSTQLGCARVKCLRLKAAYNFVCNYNPPGNYKGQKPY